MSEVSARGSDQSIPRGHGRGIRAAPRLRRACFSSWAATWSSAYSKRGESLLVDIAPDRPKETAPLGNPSRPVGPDAPAPPRQAAPPAPPAPPAPKVAPPAPQSAAAAPAPRPAPPAPKVADAPKEAPKAPPAPPKPEEGPGPKAAPPAPAPEPAQTAKATPPQLIHTSATARRPHAASRGVDAAQSSATSGMFRRGGGGGLKGGRGGIEGRGDPPRHAGSEVSRTTSTRFASGSRASGSTRTRLPAGASRASCRSSSASPRAESCNSSSGGAPRASRLLDDYAMRAVQLASPFPPVPDAISKGGLPIHGIFRYQLLGSGLINNYLR